MPCAKNMRACRKGCLHRMLVGDYHVAREASVQKQERSTRGYPTEAKDSPALTFKDYLKGHAGSVAAQQDRDVA